MPLLLVLVLVTFFSASSFRITEPLVPTLGREFLVSPATAALLASAFALPYAMCQPVLGPMADALGKARVMRICLVVLVLALIGSALASNFGLMVATRLVAGGAAGGVLPIALALTGDLFPMAERQVALSRLIFASVAGQLAGSSFSGVITESFGWRYVFALMGAMALVGFAMTVVWLEPRTRVASRPFNIAAAIASYRRVFADPRAPICYGTVFIEGILVFGLLPHLAGLLEARGGGGAGEAGFAISGIALGGILFALLAPWAVRVLGSYAMMRLGGVMVALGLVAIAWAGSWQAMLVACTVIGLGFYLLHSSVQVQATDLAPLARGSAVALHAFSYFLGVAVGPPIYGPALAALGAHAAILAAALGMAALGFAAASLLFARQPRPR